MLDFAWDKMYNDSMKPVSYTHLYAKFKQKNDPDNWAPVVISPDTVDRDYSLEQ